MALIPLDIPPGMRSMGTDLECAGRWTDCNLVRWREGSLRPVFGWRPRVDSAFTSIPRAMHTWEDNSSDRHIVGGAYDSLTHINQLGVVSDITPAGLSAGSESAGVNTGFGGGFFGVGYYGVERPDTGIYGEATTWALDNFGQYLVGCSSWDGKLYEWELDTLSAATEITGAPTGCGSLVVTEERFLFALAADSNPRLVKWCDREDLSTWDPTAENEAGDFELQTSGQIMAGVRSKGQTLIVTDTDAHTATYQGPPFVYGFERVGTSCGLISRKAICAVGDSVFWMGTKEFYHFTGTDVLVLQCDVWDHVFGDINGPQSSKAWAVANAQESEIWFFYPSEDSNEVNSYAFYNYKEGHWGAGRLDRTCGVDRGVYEHPMWAGVDMNLFEHEVGINYDGATIYAESGPISLGSGDNVFSVNKMYPDEISVGDVSATFKTRFYPNGEEREYGPYTMSAPVDVRFTGRQIRMRIEGVSLSDWRVGINRLDAHQRGVR